MVRPVRPNEKDENSFRYGDLDAAPSAGFIGGSSGGVATGGGRFTGDGQGTGFVNAKDYLGANMGKGASMGEDITSDAQGAIDGLNQGNTDFKSIQVDPFKTPFEGLDPNMDKLINRKSDTKTIMDRFGGDKGLGTDPNAPIGIPRGEARIPGAAERYDEIAESYRNRPNKYKGPSAGDINQKYDALSKLSMEGLKVKDVYNPNTSNARDMRANRLDKMANDKGISYGSGSRSFDAMLMESEGPDLFRRKYDALGRALNDFESMGAVRDEKIAVANKASADAEAFDAKQEALARDSAARERQRIEMEKEKEKEAATREPVAEKVKAGDDTMSPNSTKTTNPDGSYDVQTKVNQRGVTMRYDANGNLIEILDSNGNPIKGGGGIFD